MTARQWEAILDEDALTASTARAGELAEVARRIAADLPDSRPVRRRAVTAAEVHQRYSARRLEWIAATGTARITIGIRLGETRDRLERTVAEMVAYTLPDPHAPGLGDASRARLDQLINALPSGGRQGTT